MCNPNLTAAATFLDMTCGMTHDAFATMVCLEIQRTDGLCMDITSDRSGAWASAAAEINLYGIPAFGDTTDQAIRNWRRVAKTMTRPDHDAGAQAALLLAWAVEALTDPGMLADDDQCIHACRTILDLSRDPVDIARAQAVLKAVGTAGEEAA